LKPIPPPPPPAPPLAPRKNISKVQIQEFSEDEDLLADFIVEDDNNDEVIGIAHEL
jgi:hypothetical protein